MRLRTRILLAILGTLLVGDLLGTWLVHDRLTAGAERETANQARARALQVQSLYAERAATLVAEGEAISLYPAVIAALTGNNPAPLRTWSSQMTDLQSTRVTVTDAGGLVVARGHAPDQVGDDLSGQLQGLRLALGGQHIGGSEDGDELGLAIRGYVPVLKDGLSGPIVGAVMIAEPFEGDSGFLSRIASNSALQVTVGPTPPNDTAACAPPTGTTARCTVPLPSPGDIPLHSLVFDVPLADVERAQADAQQLLLLASAAVLVLGAVAAWWLARSLAAPLARLTAASERIAAGELNTHVDVPKSRDEIGILARAFETMRQRVALTTSSLRDERDVLDAVLESTGDGIMMVDTRGMAIVRNALWSTLLGAPDLASADALYRVEGSSTLADASSRWLAEPDHVAVGDFERRHPYQRFRVYSAPVRDRDGTILGRIFVLRDVTVETEAERTRSALVATVSHELRSPLTAITGYTDTLLHDGPWDSTTQREFLEVVSLSANRLAALVDNLLDAASLEAGVLTLQPEPIRLERIAERVLAQRRLLAGGCSLELQTEPGLPLAEADPLRVEQIIANLVDNAIKYSPEGGSVRIRVGASDDVMLFVSVSDHGLGIKPDDAARLFERFYRVESTGRSIKGVGLGLFICRSLVESHGGRIWVESQPGRGSTFVFTLPALTRTADELELAGAHA